jgi:hypothetical protein
MPTFDTLYQKGTHDGFYCPKRVVAVSSTATFSSGYTIMQRLWRAGALLVGTPSSQSPNSFGAILTFRLTHSGQTGWVSHDHFVSFPDDAERGRLLMPHHVLPYDKLASYGFDPNAEIIFALEILDALPD